MEAIIQQLKDFENDHHVEIKASFTIFSDEVKYIMPTGMDDFDATQAEEQLVINFTFF